MLRDKNIIITGANRGIGREILISLCKEGAAIIYACVRKETEEFNKLINELMSEYNLLIKPVYFNLSNDEEIKNGIKEILKDKNKIDVLINNAGISYTGLMQMTPVDKLKEVFQINYFAPVLIMQLVSRAMMRSKGGSIINIASVGGIEANPGYLAYGSSKASLIWATKSVSKELGAYGIRVNAVAPGLTDTEMGHTKSEDELEKTINRTSLRRMASPNEIADAVLYLASDKSSFVTGHILVCDGGRL